MTRTPLSRSKGQGDRGRGHIVAASRTACFRVRNYCRTNNTYIEKTKYTHKILYLRFNGLFPGGPGLAGTRMSPFWILLELRVMEVVVTTGARRRAKLQSNRHHQQTNTRLFTGRMPFLSPNQQCQRTEGTPLGHTENITT